MAGCRAGARVFEPSGSDGGAVRRRPVRASRGAGCTGPATGALACRTARWSSSGRADAQVKIRGFRIEPGEIEAVARPAPGDGAGRGRCAGRSPGRSGWWPTWCSAPRRGRRSTRSCARISHAELLPDYMVPSAFVVLDALPLTPNGKLDRRALPEPPPVSAAGSGRARARPRGAVLCALFAEVLGLRAGRHRRQLLRARRPLAAGDPADQPGPRGAGRRDCRSGSCSRTRPRRCWRPCSTATARPGRPTPGRP